jgi:uncharacterized protein YkwD
MARIRILLALMAIACAMAISAAAAHASPEKAMLKKANHFRRAHGLRTLHLSRSLAGSASRYAHDLMRSGYFGHSNRIHASGRFKRLGEILEIQRGLRPGVRIAFHAWLRSPGHRAILMDPSFNYAGAGRAAGRFQGRKSTIWVMHFGRP